MNSKDNDLIVLRDAVSDNAPRVFFTYRPLNTIPNNPNRPGQKYKQPGIGELFLTPRLIATIKACEAFIAKEGAEFIRLPLHSAFIHYVNSPEAASWVSVSEDFRPVALRIGGTTAYLICHSTESRNLRPFESLPVALSILYAAEIEPEPISKAEL